MEDDEARKNLLHGKRTATTDNTGAAFYDLREPSTATKLIQLSFVAMVVIMVAISLILSIYRSAVHQNGMYILLGLGLVGFLAVEVILILFVRNGDLPADKMWFLYFVGSCIIVECIFTNIELFR